MQCKVHLGKVDNEIYTKILCSASDLKRNRIAAGSFVLLLNEQEELQAFGRVFAFTGVKKGNIMLSTIWSHLKKQSVQAVPVHDGVAMLEAESLTLKVEKKVETGKERKVMEGYLHKMLMDSFVYDGARLELPMYGKRVEVVVECKVEKCTLYRIGATTKVDVQWSGDGKKELVQEDKDGYGHIGGLEKEIAEIHQLVDLPLRCPELFRDCGLNPPKGVLMYGPPGTGKTTIAKAVAIESKASFYVINGSELVSKYVGESEQNLKNVFVLAEQNSPSIVFIDEVDALCPIRNDKASDLEKRMVATLLTMMDGLDRKNRIVILAATNRPDALDPAIRRPGRLDREIEIGIPNVKARCDILRVAMKKLPHTLSLEELDDIAQVCNGYVGADLTAICREAGLEALERLRLNNQSLDAFTISLSDMKKGLSQVQPSALREITIDVPHVLWEDIGGQEDIKQQLKEAVEWPLQHPEAFQRLGIRPPKGVLLYGPPGCSKTLSAKAMATESQMNFIAVKGPELFSKWVGESEKAVRDVFRKARAASPAIVFFDEIDALAVQRGQDGGSGQVADRVLSQILCEMDGIHPLKQVVVIAATNRPDLIDSALLRPGRIDRILYVGPPNHKARVSIFTIHTKKMPLEDSVDLAYLATLTNGYSGAEIAAVCREAAFNGLEESRTIQKIATHHFEKALQFVLPQIDDKMLRFFQSYQQSRISK